MSVLSLETMGIDAIFVAALVTALACLAYLVWLTLSERRALRIAEGHHQDSIQGLRPGVAPRRRAGHVALHDTRR